ncbi:DUF423 domain-containing protein [Pleomorphovibrio marinus]|uniref:DUF423 domain-containing protein n=1 Tax=Pleomorphovibrio marinus TaxID=2164132 RepID=UPI000E0A4CE7|nr:DUF423 domain-containing protein [Pleomorphovibrio marinus]
MGSYFNTRSILKWAALLGGMAVALGAFGAHGLADRLEQMERIDTFQTAVDYHFYHSLALLLNGVLVSIYATIKAFKTSALFFIIGIFIFSGSLYVLSLTGITWLGAITPFGGVAFILGWVFLFLGATNIKGKHKTS